MIYKKKKKWECISGKSGSLDEYFLQILLGGIVDGLICLVSAISLNTLMMGMYPEIYSQAWVFIPVFILMMIYSVVNYFIKNSLHSWIRFILDGIVVAMGTGYFVNAVKKPHGTLLDGGWFAIVNHFLKDYNSFYKTKYLEYVATPGDMVDLWSLAVLASALLMGMIAIETGKKWIVYIPSVILAGIGLWVGRVPCAWGVLLVVLGIVFLASPVYVQKKQGMMIGSFVVVLLLSVVLTKIVFFLPANVVSTKVSKSLGLKEKLLNEENETITKNGMLKAGKIEVCKVNNVYPKFQNKEDLYVYTRRPPISIFYLRGAYGDEYRNGSWERTLSDNYIKENYPKLAKYKEKKRSKMVASENFSGYKASGYVTKPKILSQEFEITYTKLKSDCVYLPYGVDGDSLDCAGKWYTMDYMALSKKQRKEYSVRALNLAVVYQGLESFCGYEPKLENQEFYDEYSKMVQKEYIDVPEEQVTAKTLAKEIKDTKAGEFIKKKKKAKLEEGSAAQINLERLFYAGEVKKALQKRCTYATEFDSNEEADAVEYFLAEGHKGFCVHFASAGIFMLRQLGIPSRLAYGYAVTGRSFKSEDKANYFVSIKDNKIHAWPEIYLENYGWVPYDMTPGYESKDDIYVKDKSYVGIKEEREKKENKLIEDIKGDTGSDNKFMDWEKAKKVILKQLLVIVMACAAVAVLFLGGVNGYRQWCYRKIRLFQKTEQYKEAIMILKKLLYLELCLEERKRLRFKTDKEYVEYLKKNYPSFDWEEYMMILQKDMFSMKAITKEEWKKVRQALLCVRRYKEISGLS